MSSIPLEELIKTNLENYEARYDSNDWARMETVLGTAPDSRPFNWKPLLIAVIVLGLVGGGYVLFTTVDFSKILSKSTPAATPTPAVVKKTPVTPPKKTETPATPPPAPVININTDSIRQAEEAKAAAALAAKEEEERIQREEAEKEEARLKKERRREKEEPTKEEIELRRARRRAMANADSNKTNNNSSNESAKEQDKPKSTHIGLNIFSTMNADSLKKYQEKVKKDSTK
jgi:type IV secretory pathway VirB10-like protein